jgi:pyridoxamine 5'-phosphate oxidase
MDRSKKIFELRKNYTMGGLSKYQTDPDAMEQFNRWFDQAMLAELPEPNAMTLATASAKGKVSSRVVLLKEFDKKGFVFFTNYNSRKGKDISENPFGALSFLWLELERQVRIEGEIEKITPEESDQYFESRPRGSQLGAWASEQSSRVDSRIALSELYNALEKKYANKNIPRPPHWGGYRLIPDTIEFWQGGPGRIHDRILYFKAADGISWNKKRLAP